MTVTTPRSDRARPSASHRALRVTRAVLATIGTLSLGALALGIVRDASNFDRTRGGYEAPYTDFTGTPIDFGAGYRTARGIYSPGVVIATHLNCTTGMVSFRVFGQEWNWRKVSERAIVVHRPREACQARGFTPRF